MRAITLALTCLLVPWVRAEEIRIPKATLLILSLDQELDAKKLKKGKTLKTHLAEPLRSDTGEAIIRAGSEVKGKVEDADERHLTLKFKEIKTPSGKKSIEARLVGVDADNVKVDGNELESPGRSRKKKAANAGSTAAGMATGGMAGTAVAGIGRIIFGHGGKDLKLKKGTLLRIELKK